LADAPASSRASRIWDYSAQKVRHLSLRHLILSRSINTLQGDGEDELDLPSLDFLLNRDPTRLSSESHNTLGREKPTESTLQIQGWAEVPGPDGTLILRELSDAQAPNTDDMREEQWLAMQFAYHKPVSASDSGPVPRESDRVATNAQYAGVTFPVHRKVRTSA
jgi:hypothetical protein